MIRRLLDAPRRAQKWGEAPKFDLDDDYLESVQASLWMQSPERGWYMSRRPRIYKAVCVGISLALLAILLGQPPRSDVTQWWAVATSVAAAIVIVYSTVPYWAARRAFLERRRKTAEYRAEISLKRLTELADIPFSGLFGYNRRQLDAYQEESRNQQRTAFRQAQLASIAGFTVLIVGVLVSLDQSIGSEKYIVAGLAGLGAVLSGFITNTFANSAKQANRQLNLYYNEPHMVGRMIVAERLVHSLPDESRSEEVKLMIAQILGWPLPDSLDRLVDEPPVKPDTVK